MQADFVFIDPPAWKSNEYPDYPIRDDYYEHVLKPRGQSSLLTLLWKGSSGNRGIFEGKSADGDLQQAAEFGYHWTGVRWNKAGSGSACILIYNQNTESIRASIDYIVKLPVPSWEVIHSP